MASKNVNPSSAASLLAALEGISHATAQMARHSATIAKVCAELLVPAPGGGGPAQPTAKPTRQECQDPRNKIGVNLSTRGVELIYRLFDHDSSVRAASIAMDISHRAAKWRKAAWQKAGGKDRPTTRLDIDEA